MSDSRRILESIRRLVRLLRVSDRAAQTSAGLSAAQLFVLAELGKQPEQSLSELAERTRTDQSSVSTVVSRLVDGGLVARERDAADARRLVLTLTRNGRVALQKAPPVAQEQLIDVIDALPARERAGFAETFERILGALDSDDAPPPMFFEEPARPRKRATKERSSGHRK
jgi:DNA-binding MarR family transcriptional regulator